MEAFAPCLGANSFLLEEDPFQKGVDVQESKQEVSNISSLSRRKMVVNQLSMAIHLF